ncbi:hypothetical protein V6N11_051609 [Hibiscus sabdariffa]|uniref:Uncharacterized protein n=1 Tax=Hibiscus sabdariffa TaxID=183260 RepID=A0ABR2U7N6_9ROSI
MNGGRSRGRGFAGDGRKSGGSMVVPISYPWLLLMCGGNEEGMGELSIKGNGRMFKGCGLVDPMMGMVDDGVECEQ